MTLPSSDGGTSYRWTPSKGLSDPNVAHPSHEFQTSITYRVRITFSDGCQKEDIVNIQLINESSYTLHIPNVFSPNGDGINDVFEYTGFFDGIVQFEAQIWNRWGEKIFETEDITEFWNGQKKNNGLPVKDGAYAYIIKIKDQCGVTANRWDRRIGWVMVLKGDSAP